MRREFVQASCEGKECLPTWKVARDRAARMTKSRKGEGIHFEPYRCKACGSIHVGSQDGLHRKGRYKRHRPDIPDETPGYPGHEAEVVY